MVEYRDVQTMPGFEEETGGITSRVVDRKVEYVNDPNLGTKKVVTVTKEYNIPGMGARRETETYESDWTQRRQTTTTQTTSGGGRITRPLYQLGRGEPPEGYPVQYTEEIGTPEPMRAVDGKSQQITFQRQQELQGNPAVPTSMLGADIMSGEGEDVERELAEEEQAYTPQAKFQTGRREGSAMPISMIASEITGFEQQGMLAPVEIEDVGLQAFSAGLVLAESVVAAPYIAGATFGRDVGTSLRKVFVEGQSPAKVGKGMLLKTAIGIAGTVTALPALTGIGSTGMTPEKVALVGAGVSALGSLAGMYTVGRVMQRFPSAAAAVKQNSIFSYKIGTHTVGWTKAGSAIFAPEYKQSWLAPIGKMGLRPAQATFPSFYGRSGTIVMPRVDTDVGWRRIYPAGMEKPALIMRNAFPVWDSSFARYSPVGLESAAPMVLLRQKAAFTPQSIATTRTVSITSAGVAGGTVTSQAGMQAVQSAAMPIAITRVTPQTATTPKVTTQTIARSIQTQPKLELKLGFAPVGLSLRKPKRSLFSLPDLGMPPERRVRKRERRAGGRGYSYVPNLAGILTGAGGLKMPKAGFVEFLPRGLFKRKKKRR